MASRQQLAQRVAALYKQAGLPQPSKQGVLYYINKGDAGLSLLQQNLAKDPRTTFYQQANPAAPTETTPAETTPPTYQQFLEGAGKSYADNYSDEVINQQFDPYYNKQLGAEDYSKGLAQQDLNQNIQDTTKALASTYNDQKGLYGSGMYQDSLTRGLDQLNQGFNRQYGSGEYTPYNLRKQEILQNQMTAKAQERLSRQQQSFNVYQQTYMPEFAQ